MIPISRPSLGQEEEQAVLDVMRSGQLAQGERVRRFEEAFARATEAGAAVATLSGSSSLRHRPRPAEGAGVHHRAPTSHRVLLRRGDSDGPVQPAANRPSRQPQIPPIHTRESASANTSPAAVSDRDELRRSPSEAGIAIGIYYPVPVGP